MTESNSVFKREKLSKNAYSVRAGHLVNIYGVGAMVNFQQQVLMTAAPEYWPESSIGRIYDERLQKKLNVDYFGLPVDQEKQKYSSRVSYVRFPQWYFCPKCHKFKPMKQWVKEYRALASQSEKDKDPYMVMNPHCPECGKYVKLVATRFVTICEHGHINDFPWVEWAHKKEGCCANPKLVIKAKGTGTYSFANIYVECTSCGAKENLEGVMADNFFERADGKNKKEVFRCKGGQPWKNTQESCSLYPRAVLRNAASVYYPVEESSLVIPPYEKNFYEIVRNSQPYEAGYRDLMRKKKRGPMSYKDMEEFVGDITDEIINDIGTVLKRKDVYDYLMNQWGETEKSDACVVSDERRFREEEYEALTGEAIGANEGCSFLVREVQDEKLYGLPFLKQIVLIHKLREVRALIGFSRVNPVINRYDREHFVDIKSPDIRFYPGYQVHGEGIFISFDDRQIAFWINKNKKVIEEREAIVARHYEQTMYSDLRARNITAKFILLHSFAHALIRQLSFEAGYSISALRERIYCDGEDGVGKKMAGILIYTASGDSEGTLGGLVRQGYKEIFPNVVHKAIQEVKHCSNDPVCSLSQGQGNYSLNLAACHACLLLPETSCEEFNSFLDRGLLIGTMDEPDIGFFSDGFQTYEKGMDVIPRKPPVQNFAEANRMKSEDLVSGGMGVHEVHAQNLGQFYDGKTPSAVWKELMKDCIEENDFTGNGIVLKLAEKAKKEIPSCYYGSVFKDNENENIFEANLCFKEKKVFLFLSGNKEGFDKAKKTGWYCFLMSDEFNLDEFLTRLGIE